jgi:glycerophosphoryl diester phosphodiesterase
MASVARKSGIATQVWTVNDPAIARSYWAGGVAGIVTDDPVAMIRARGS